jgi:cyclopropane-fatty-acyl-phospholipid synthase
VKGLSLKAKVFLSLLRHTRGGTLHVRFPDGMIESFGQGAPEITMNVREWHVIDDLLNKGDLGMAESIIAGTLEVDNVAALIQWACFNEDALSRLIHGTWYGTLFDRLCHLMRPNNRRGAKKNIIAHYDLGNDFYRLWLDNTMTYSSGIFESADQDLSKAQFAKYDRIIQALDIKSSDHILEIGCGWGGFFTRAVETTGCKVTAVMNSPSQAEFNRQLIGTKGFQGHVDLQQIDYRDIKGRFDKVVSIEMIEAVGQNYWSSFFDKVSASLKTGGTAMIQSITINDSLFDDYRSKTDFIQRYVFPGGMLLAPKIFEQYGKNSSFLTDQPFEFGLSYAETLVHWRDNFLAQTQAVRDLGFDDNFMRLWKLYLEYCEGAFRAGRINVGHYLLQKQDGV